MKILEKYIFNTFSTAFFPIFLTLYIITSIIFLVQIAALTSIIQMNLLELLKLYSYSIPTIIFYTLPISYFVGAVLTISKLSAEYEMIVITSFGLNSLKIVKLLFPTTIVISILLLIVSLGLAPKAEYQKKAFLNIKKQEAQFNIKPSEYGQQFGKWLLYVNKELENKVFKDITLLQLSKNKDTLTSAKYATMHNNGNTLNLQLQNGKSFVLSDTLKQVDFEKMLLNDSSPKQKNIKSLNDIVLYWSDRKTNLKKSKDFTFNIFISLFPLISIFFIISVGYFNPRYDSNKATMLSSFIVILFIVIANQLARLYPNTGLYTLPFLWIFFSYIYYYFTIKKLY